MADENMVQNAVQPQENHYNDDGKEWKDEKDDESGNEPEFEAINAQLDQLNSALDSLERKNDDIHAELVELLQSNREARRQFQESQMKTCSALPNPQM